MSGDEKWADLARSSRAALRLLGYDGPDCLPGEPGECGGSFIQHFVAHLGALKAVANHHLVHAGGHQMASDVEMSVLHDLAATCPNHPREIGPGR